MTSTIIFALAQTTVTARWVETSASDARIVEMKCQCKRRRYDKDRERNNNWWDSRSWFHQSQTDRGKCNCWPAKSMRRRDPCNWRCWGKAHWRKWRRALLAIDADEIFCTIAKVTADQIIARRVVLARIRFAFVDILITSEMTSQKLKNLIFEHFQ